MARSLRIVVLTVFALGLLSTLPRVAAPAFSAELDKKGKADAREAMRLYKAGSYEEAAKIFVNLSIAYPDMLVFVRNLGACYYYLRRYEPALSNLRDYVHRKKDMTPDDHAEVERWIGEMERLRDQALTPPPAPVVAAAPILVAPPVPAPAPMPAASPEPFRAPAASAGEPYPGAAPAPAVPATPPPAAVPAAPPPPPLSVPPPQPAAGPMPSQPAYPPPQQPVAPAYPPSPYGAPPSAYPAAPYPPPGYAPPAGSPEAYPPAGAQPLGVTAPAPPAAEGGTARKVVAWVLGFAGFTTLGVGGYWTYKGLKDFRTVEDKYDPAVEKRGKDTMTNAYVCYGVGGAAVLVAIIVGASGGSSSPEVALAPFVGPGGGGAVVSGSF